MFSPVNAGRDCTGAVFGGVVAVPSKHSQFPSSPPPASFNYANTTNEMLTMKDTTTSCQTDTVAMSIEASLNNVFSSLNSGSSSHGFTQSCGKLMQTEPG